MIIICEGGIILLSTDEYIMYSLEYNLFFGRIIKEHLIFIQAGLPMKNSELILEVDDFKEAFETLLQEIVSMANENVSMEAIKSQEFVTKNTLDAEILTQFYTGICINTDITKIEMMLSPNPNLKYPPSFVEQVYYINENAKELLSLIIPLKKKIHDEVLKCRIFSYNYPTLLMHVIEEAEYYMKILNALQRGDEKYIKDEEIKRMAFWDEIMEEHALFIRGLLDPEEEELFKVANNLAEKFEELEEKTEDFPKKEADLNQLIKETLEAAKEIKSFKTSGTEGILECKIKSIIIPLLADHTLREANHYIRILNSFKK